MPANWTELEVGDRVIFMDSGYIVEEGTSERVFDAPKHEEKVL